MTLRWRITLVIAALVAATSLVLTYVFQQGVMEDHRQDHINWASTLSNALAKAILRDTLAGSKIDVQTTLSRVRQTNPDLVYLVEIGFDSQPFASTFDGELPAALARLDHGKCLPGSTRSVQLGDKTVHDVAYPVIEKLGAHLHLGLNDESFSRSVDQAILKTVYAAALILLAALAAAIVISRRISRPLMRLTDSVTRFGRGEPFDKGGIPSGDREVRLLVNSFDQMVQERLQAEAARNRLAAILEATTDFVGMADTSGKVFYLNHAGRAMAGLGEQAGLGGPIAAFHPAWATELILATGLPVAAQHNFWEGETAVLRPDGSEIPVSQLILAHHDEQGQLQFFSTIIRDISERKRNAEELRRLNLELERRVEQRTAELASTNADLHQTLETLQHAQDELVRSEKLASLGSLVAGVAHELNTPLGNSLTLATALADHVRQFNAEFSAGNVRRSSLVDFVDFSQKACAILTSSLFTASELISHFKQVAVDQTSEQRRPFELAETVSEVVMTLQPQFKKTPHQLQIAIPAGIAMDSFPGPLGQVITNLVSNALIHGLPDHPGGTVRIEASSGDGQATITISDNGKGIPPENLPRIFDPFFTTRLGQGGSGLGLHIVYSIVVQLLGGRITATSELGKGTVFTVQLPLIAPEAANTPLGSAIAIPKEKETA